MGNVSEHQKDMFKVKRHRKICTQAVVSPLNGECMRLFWVTNMNS